MPKTKKKTEKRSVTCGKCKETGHNARTCPTSAEAPKVEAPKADAPAKVSEVVKSKKEPARMNTVPKRSAPTQGNTSENNHAPYRCNACSQVAILVAVRTKDYHASSRKGHDVFQAEMRCERCMNKPSPAELILKWGCSPNEVVPIPGQDA